MAVTLNKVEKWAQKKKVGKLLKALPDVDNEVRIAIIRALGNTNDEKAMNIIISYLRDPDALIRLAAAEALGTMANGRALEFVRQMWNIETDTAAHEKAFWAMQQIKEKMATTVKHID